MDNVYYDRLIQRVLAQLNVHEIMLYMCSFYRTTDFIPKLQD